MPSTPLPGRRLTFRPTRGRRSHLACYACPPSPVEERLALWRKGELAQSRRQHGGTAMHDRAIWLAPPGRDRPRTSRRLTASKTCAVQMLEVAFSRRICCSRVCSASRYAGSPRASTDKRRGGRERALQRIAHRHIGGVSRQKPIARQSAARSDRDVGAEFAGRRRSVSASRSAATTAARPSPAALRSPGRRAPRLNYRFCSNAPNISALSRSVRGSPTIKFPRSGSARVRSTATSAGVLRHRRRMTLPLPARARSASAICLGCSRGLIEHDGGDVEPSQIADHGLEVEQSFQPAPG